jgi:serine/threonine protein kinase
LIGASVGHYFLVRQIAEGGTGAVYLARHRSLGTRKAVKLLLPQFSHHMSLVWRLQCEATTLARLDHRNIVKVDDFGQLSDGQWYIMMPFLEGVPLERLLRSYGHLPLHQSLHIVSQICAALHSAHSMGVIHRDLKPGNVLVTSEAGNPWRATLLDFGISKNEGAEPTPFSTDSESSFGTPAFMAAEVMEDATRASARSDIYSLGVLAYRMVVGTYPFGDGSQTAAVVYRLQVSERPRFPSFVPPGWAAVIARALSRNPDERPASAAEFAIALAAATPAQSRFPAGVDILTTVARELVIPDSGPVAAPIAARKLAEQARWPLWPPVQETATHPTDLAAQLTSGAVVPGGSSLATTTTIPRMRLRRVSVRDWLRNPGRVRERLVVWVVSIVLAVLIGSLAFR